MYMMVKFTMRALCQLNLMNNDMLTCKQLELEAYLADILTGCSIEEDWNIHAVESSAS